MTKRIEAELTEINYLKRSELEFLFFRARMDNSLLQKYRNALVNGNTPLEYDDVLLQIRK